jgi:spore germination protein
MPHPSGYTLRRFGLIALTATVLLFASSQTWAAPPYRVTAWTFGDAASFSAAADAGAIDEISVDWYVSQRDLTVGTAGEDLAFVAAAQTRGVRVLATVTDLSLRTGRFTRSISRRVLRRPESIDAHVAALVALCVSKGYDGIDLDWEAMRPRDKDLLSTFVSRLADGLHQEGKILSMAIAPKDSEPGTWSAPQSEDYAALGTALDEFKIMTYDYSGSWSPPGPIAPPVWMDSVLTYTESLVAPAKVMMGVPFYGYDWRGKRTTDVLWSDAQGLIATYAAAVTHDASGEATFSYTDTRGSAHSVLFQDVDALSAKLDVLTAMHPNIGGIAIWVMGGEDPAFWTEIDTQLH